VILWFAGVAVVAVWVIFRDPAIDHRLVVAGAVLPDAADALLGFSGLAGPWPAHTLLASAGLLTGIMVGTRGRRRLRRRLLAVPIGSFLHLVLDAAWADTQVFWWPVFGFDPGHQVLPTVERGWVNLPLEVAGLAALAWAWYHFGLADPGRRSAFLRGGHLGKDLVG
jgi:hypothetical protein